MNLEIELLPLDKVQPNQWNPNKQTERQFEAEIESICSNGFIAPILVRKRGDKYEILDGEHRYRAMHIIIENELQGVKNVPELVAAKKIPAIVIEANDAQAKKLTIIMNETRGRAELGELAILLDDISKDVGDDLLIGLPYSEKQLNDLLSLSEFDWDNLAAVELPDPADYEENNESIAKIVAHLTPEAEILWKEALIKHATFLPKDSKQAAGKLIEILLNR